MTPDAPVDAQSLATDESVTEWIQAWSAGDAVAGDRLFARVYQELHQIARRRGRARTHAGADETLDTTALVHEVYLRLSSTGALRVTSREHFFAMAVRITRQIVSNYARQATATKRGGGAHALPLDEARVEQATVDALMLDRAARITALDDALVALERLHPRPCRVVECRFFGALSIPETAAVLGISDATVKRDWALAQAWLHRALRDA